MNIDHNLRSSILILEDVKMKKFVAIIIGVVFSLFLFNSFVFADEEGEDGVDPATIPAEVNPADQWVMSQNIMFKGQSVKLYPNAALRFDISGQTGTRYNSILSMNIPYNELTITSKNDKPVTVVKVYINRGQCSSTPAANPLNNNYYIPDFKFGASHKLRVEGRDCNVIEVSLVTLNDGFIVYKMQ